MSLETLQISTSGEGFYDITEQVKNLLKDIKNCSQGVLYLFITHTSCALTINEAFDPSAKTDMENFMKHLAPRSLPFITHTSEGPDDSPSHMKSMLLNQNLLFPIENGQLVLGTWQGIYLAEFRDAPSPSAHKTRKILLKFVSD